MEKGPWPDGHRCARGELGPGGVGWVSLLEFEAGTCFWGQEALQKPRVGGGVGGRFELWRQRLGAMTCLRRWWYRSSLAKWSFST